MGDSKLRATFNDLANIVDTGKEHFIGTFVYQEKPTADIFKDYIIIDGQQRITSIILLAKAIYDLTDEEDLKEDIRATFIKHDKGTLKGKCKLRPNEYDRDTFDKLMSDDAFNENNFTAAEKSSELYRNYSFFSKKLFHHPNDQLSKFHNAIHKLNIVSILLEDENTQEIFESLNSTGLALSKADLIRNFLLMPLAYEQQEEFYKKYWLEIENLLKPSNNVEKFIIQYLITKRKSNSVVGSKKKLSPNNLYDTFKKFFEKNYPNVEECLRDMLRYAKFFHRLIFNDDTKFENLSALDKKFYELIFLLKADNAPIILMYLLNRYEKNHFDEATFIKFVDALISFTFRSKICGGSGITAQFAGEVLARLDNKDKEISLDEKIFWKAITFGEGKSAFPNDETFQNELTTKNLYYKDVCKYLLYSLERSAGKEVPAYSPATIEHIMPQKLNDDWEKYLKAHNDSDEPELFLHTLGNLTLTAYNSELGNKNFDDKKIIYSDSNFSYTRALADYSDWTTRQIQDRAKKLAAEAIKIWTLPAEFNDTLSNGRNHNSYGSDFFDLNSDFATLTFRKPAILFIFGKERELKTWKNMLIEVAWQLYNYDADTFRRVAKSENIRRNLFTTEPTDYKIDDGLYINVPKVNTKDCLNTIKKLVETFDSIGDTDIKDEIYFTLKPLKPEQATLFDETKFTDVTV